MKTGLVSISFRKLSPLEIVTAAAGAGLDCIEWGGDVHVPHGDTARAEEVARLTADHGLSISAYGSYLRLNGDSEPSPAAVLDSASALGAQTIRVWAGKKGSASTTPEERSMVVETALSFADLASARGMSISYEFHGGTFTDTGESAALLLAETPHPAIFSLWQPTVGLTTEACLDALQKVLPRLSNVHAFHWWPTQANRLPLIEGRERWISFLGTIHAAGKNPDVLLEFLPNDNIAALPAEAAALREIIADSVASR